MVLLLGVLPSFNVSVPNSGLWALPLCVCLYVAPLKAAVTHSAALAQCLVALVTLKGSGGKDKATSVAAATVAAGGTVSGKALVRSIKAPTVVTAHKGEGRAPRLLIGAPNGRANAARGLAALVAPLILLEAVDAKLVGPPKKGARLVMP